MRRFRIHWSVERDGEGYEDSIIIEGEDIEEVRQKASMYVASRGGTDPWSEELT